MVSRHIFCWRALSWTHPLRVNYFRKQRFARCDNGTEALVHTSKLDAKNRTLDPPLSCVKQLLRNPEFLRTTNPDASSVESPFIVLKNRGVGRVFDLFCVLRISLGRAVQTLGNKIASHLAARTLAKNGLIAPLIRGCFQRAKHEGNVTVARSGPQGVYFA